MSKENGVFIEDLSNLEANRKIVIKGASEHNLKGVDLAIPKNKLVVFTGLSGSGKSSLAFDTLCAEGQRRYMQSLSSYARQFLGQIPKPKVDSIEGLSPTISIDQKTTNHNPRSTVGTVTEIYDYMRVLFSRVAVPHCPICFEEVGRQSAEQIVDAILERGGEVEILSPLAREKKGTFESLFSDLASKGYARAVADGKYFKTSDPPELKKQEKHTVFALVDRLDLKPEERSRLTDSVESALELSGGSVVARFKEGDKSEDEFFSEKVSCPNGHIFDLDMEPRSFSFNSPLGACPSCGGLGTKEEMDLSRVIKDPSLSLAEGAIDPWNHQITDHSRELWDLSRKMGFSMDEPWKDLPANVREAILYKGWEFSQGAPVKNRWGQKRSQIFGFESVSHWLERKIAQTDSELIRSWYSKWMHSTVCSECGGKRLRPEILAAWIDGKSIVDVCQMPVKEEEEWVKNLRLTPKQELIAKDALKAIGQRLEFLLDIGLDYLTLMRSASTLSGGEAQRIRLANQIGSKLTGVMYVLDEPSIGLHQRDNDKMLSTLRNLQALDNTVIVVEHDEDTIRSSDWLVDVGPLAGKGGGEIIYSGAPEGIARAPLSITGQYMTGKKKICVPASRRAPGGWLKLKDVNKNNLKHLDVSIPLQVFSTITGVSGSGKSTLMDDILYPRLANALNGSGIPVDEAEGKMEGEEALDKVIYIDQSPIGRTPRSNPATYTGVWNAIRDLFARTPEAQVRGYKPGRFSFNEKGGRCETCHGDGVINIEMNFLPAVQITCDACGGRRYNRETLQVEYDGKNISQVLEMTVSEAASFFKHIPSILRYLKALEDVGLGYISLGQNATTLSGGEAQRVKLASELQKKQTGRTIYLLDEPTTGLHAEDVRKLLEIFKRLVDKKNTLVVIEHNLDVIKSCDYVLDLGPEGGDKGGKIVAAGTPEQVAKTGTWTGKYLARALC
ncbi:MAG: excinuclease ABC subunit UvrA [Aeriscardovia sp.]|nr:excinuclease ABC subunit UvrA [Aeriscardovia sp.]